MDALHILGWLGFGYVALRDVGYVLGARVCELALATEFSDGCGIQTTNARFAAMHAPASVRVEEQPGLAVADLISRHAARLTSENSQQHAIRLWNLEDVLDRVARSFVEVRDRFRKRGWVSPTANPALDSFTLRGAFALTHFSMRVLKPQGGGLGPQSPRARQMAVAAEERPNYS